MSEPKLIQEDPGKSAEPTYPPYAPPRMTVLGSLAEITLGHVSTKSDGTNPGSLF
jgi:hypothetical protein